jgi:hypothetical protein
MAPFVYQQKNRAAREGAEVCEIYCKRAACSIQHCLARLVPNHQGQIDQVRCPQSTLYSYSPVTAAPRVPNPEPSGFLQAQCSFVIEKYNNCCQAAIVKFGEGEEGCRAARAAKGERV